MWFIGADGMEIGPTSVAETGLPIPATFVLQPRSQASSTLWYDNPGVMYPPCQMTVATELQVIPPGESTSLHAGISIQTCTSGTRLATTPLTTGTGETPF
jgi:hypothetical protein